MSSSVPPGAKKSYLHFASGVLLSGVARVKQHRSGCPVGIALDILGDRWSLLIIRDLMVRGYKTFQDFQHSGEGIATNILADRLARLAAAGLIMAETPAEDRRRREYRLTEKGIALAPVVLELLIWAGRHEDTGAPGAVIDYLESHRQTVLAEVQRRWRERDPEPFLPPFESMNFALAAPGRNSGAN